MSNTGDKEKETPVNTNGGNTASNSSGGPFLGAIALGVAAKSKRDRARSLKEILWRSKKHLMKHRSLKSSYAYEEKC
uniref:Uncharacterized protein n=1 Tax=Oryza sativa subsp. japonica TaxID=39947 RepID=Q6YX76_ORYSJ|nr:hypothetical protein [Oryza sativa Japonica Group]